MLQLSIKSLLQVQVFDIEGKITIMMKEEEHWQN